MKLKITLLLYFLLFLIKLCHSMILLLAFKTLPRHLLIIVLIFDTFVLLWNMSVIRFH